MKSCHKLSNTKPDNHNTPTPAPRAAGTRRQRRGTWPWLLCTLALALTLGTMLGMAGAAGASPTTTAAQPAALDLAPLHPLAPLDPQGDSAEGAYPVAPLTLGDYGTLYGVTSGGGAHAAGTIFKVNPDGTGYTVLHSLEPSADGAAPWGAVFFYGTDVLYGTTYSGGPSGGGTVWTMKTDGTGFTLLHAFDTTFGYPLTGLVSGGDGFFYATTSGGPSGTGLVYRIAPDGSGYGVLHTFWGGDTPWAPLLVSAGVLYGTTYAGGLNGSGAGSVFKVCTGGSGYAVLYSFTGGPDGGNPEAGLTSGGDGFLYGTTSDDQLASNGSVFRLHEDGSGFSTLYRFSGGGDGGSPLAPVCVGSDGNLYGTTFSGGSDGSGTVFGVGPDGSGFTTLVSLSGSGSDGGGPSAGLTLGSGGAWYGTSYQGGPGGTGALFALVQSSSRRGVSPSVTTHTHLLWNNSDGRVMLWSVAADGTFTLNGFGPYTDNAPSNKWSATAVATGPDGKSHLLWNNTDGRVMLWTVDDAGNFSLAGYGPYTDGAPQNKWSATAISVGPDNTVHILWNNTDGRVMLWNVDSAFNFTLAGYGPYTDTSVSSDPGNLWSATALATGPDNVSRIVWNNTDGRVMLWDVNADFSFTLAGFGPYTDGAPQNKWSAVGVSVGPDNLTHLLWSNTDRRAMFWNVNTDFSFTLAGYGPYTDDTPGNLWSAAAVATGPDGLSHLLWGNTDRRAMLWGVDSAFDFTVAGYGPYTDNAPQNLWSATAISAGP